MNNPHDITDEEIDESNAKVRKDWQAVKRIIFNRNFLIGFIAISVLIIDLIIIDHFSPYLREKIVSSELISSSSYEDE